MHSRTSLIRWDRRKCTDHISSEVASYQSCLKVFVKQIKTKFGKLQYSSRKEGRSLCNQRCTLTPTRLPLPSLSVCAHNG